MKYRLSATAVILVSLFCVLAPSRNASTKTDELPSGHQQMTIPKDGRDRQYLLYVPTRYNKSKAVPLVIMFHGMGGTAMNSQKETGWSSKAEMESFIVAYPEGTRPDINERPSLGKNPQAWNDGSGRFFVAEQEIDDVGFVATLIDQISAITPLTPIASMLQVFQMGRQWHFESEQNCPTASPRLLPMPGLVGRTSSSWRAAYRSAILRALQIH